MAILTVHRSCSSSGPPSSSSSSCESFFVVNGAAALVLLPSGTRRRPRRRRADHLDEHLASMFALLDPRDSIVLAVRLESTGGGGVRYAVVVSRLDRLDTDEAGVLGLDLAGGGRASVGLVMPVYADLATRLGGDGRLTLASNGEEFSIRPVTVQAMWSAFQSLNRAAAQARALNYHPCGISHTWLLHAYRAPHLRSPQPCLDEWNTPDDVRTHRPYSLPHRTLAAAAAPQLELIRTRLKDIMTRVDLDQVTSTHLRQRLEQELDTDLAEYDKFIDDVIMQVFAHMDAASQITPFLFLGSEWNASNFEELTENNVRFVLNVSNEIDNFYPAHLTYLNIRVTDSEQTELIRQWNRTFEFVSEAKERGVACLVHCKMGISRSAACVVAFVMKDMEISLDEAMEYVKNRRSCIRPNKGFMEQLKVYEGILHANRVSREQFIQEQKEEEENPKFNSCFDWTSRLMAEPALSSSSCDERDFVCGDEDGNRYIFDKFMSSLYEQKGEVEPHRTRSATAGDSCRSKLIPRVTRPDGFWIRSCPTSSASSESDLSISNHRCGSIENEPIDTGTVRRRVIDLEAKTTTTSNHHHSKKRKPFKASSCENLSRINKIDRLVKLYSSSKKDHKKESSIMRPNTRGVVMKAAARFQAVEAQ